MLCPGKCSNRPNYRSGVISQRLSEQSFGGKFKKIQLTKNAYGLSPYPYPVNRVPNPKYCLSIHHHDKRVVSLDLYILHLVQFENRFFFRFSFGIGSGDFCFLNVTSRFLAHCRCRRCSHILSSAFVAIFYENISVQFR